MSDAGGDESLMWLSIRGRTRQSADDKTAEREEVQFVSVCSSVLS